jgi:hypothetical protein
MPVNDHASRTSTLFEQIDEKYKLKIKIPNQKCCK